MKNNREAYRGKPIFHSYSDYRISNRNYNGVGQRYNNNMRNCGAGNGCKI